MKTFTFFNQKGGVGKTTLIILFAAYLRYHLGFRVKVIDFQAPDPQVEFFRKLDLKNAARSGSFLANFLGRRDRLEPYPIEAVGKPANEYADNDLEALVMKINEEVKRDQYDYLLLDFPGEYSKKTPISYLIRYHLLDGLYIPFSTEPQEYSDAFKHGVTFKQMHQPCRLMWYRLSESYLKNKADALDEADRGLSEYGLEVSKVRIRAFNKATESSEVRCFVRNTLCWPDRYVKMVCPELIPLFEEIVQFLDSV